jgi:hypothetical protein
MAPVNSHAAAGYAPASYPAVRVLRFLQEMRALLRFAHFASRTMHSELELFPGDSLAGRIHKVRMAAKELRRVI